MQPKPYARMKVPIRGVPPRAPGRVSNFSQSRQNKALGQVFYDGVTSAGSFTDKRPGCSTSHCPTNSSRMDLLINIDHVATLRNARRERFPDPVHAAVMCESAGADGIVFHLREDRRHITDRDVRLLKEVVRTKLDFELSTDPEVVHICCEAQPQLATLVPERREEVTTEGGLDVVGNRKRLTEVTRQLLDAGIPEVAFFLDPDLDQIDAAAEAGANCIELHTGDFASAADRREESAVLERLAAAARHADSLGLKVHAGHGLDYQNFSRFSAAVRPVKEVSIGFAIISRALFVGLDRAVQEMRELVKSA
jgi:pyridoxine 5-phosphate synthase